MTVPLSARSRVTLPLAIVLIGTLPWVWHYILTPEPGRWMVDLQVYRDAGHSLLTGRDIYDWRTPAPQNLPFTYPPIGAVLAVPLALVPFKVAGVIWFYAQILATFALVRLAGGPLIRRAGERGPLLWGVLTLLTMYMLPVADGLRYGQVNAFLVLAVLLDVLRPARPALLNKIPHGMLIGIATAIKLTPGVFLIHLLVTRQWRAAGTAILSAAVVTVGMFVVMPKTSVTYWFHALRDPERVGRNDGTANQSIRAVLMRVGPEGVLSDVLWVLLVALVVVVGFGTARRAHRSGDRLTEFSAVAVTGLLISPVTWTHHLHWLVPALFVILGTDPLRHRARMVGTGLLWLALTLHLTWWAHYQLMRQGTWERYLSSGDPFWTVVHNSYALCAAIILGTLAVLEFRRPVTPHPSDQSAHETPQEVSPAER